MGSNVNLKYGNTFVKILFPAGTEFLNIREPEKNISEKRFAVDLASSLSVGNLSGRKVCVVVADKTRLCAYDRYLPVLVNQLQANGVESDNITIFIAYGTHPIQSDVESKKAYGEVFTKYRFVHHGSMDKTLFQEMGRTSRGTAIRFRKDILKTDFLITFGAISHHYFAGFGGGRKLIFPGLGNREAIYQNHGLFLDSKSRTLSPGCRPGKLDGNPVAEDLAEIEGQKPADLAIHGILDSRGRVCRLLVGKGGEHFKKACSLHGENCEMQGKERFEMVVASCGGHPKDINFIQAHKAIHNAADFVTDSGTLILFACCPDGVGSTTFLPWFQMGNRDSVFDHLLNAYQGNGGTALALMEKTERIRICLVTDLSSDICQTIGIEKLDEMRVADTVSRHHGSLAVIPNAGLLVRIEQKS